MIKPPANKEAMRLKLCDMVADYRTANGFVSKCPPGIKSDNVRMKSYEQRQRDKERIKDQ